MRNLIFWGISILLVAVALTAAISMMTVRWLYPSAPIAGPTPTPGPAQASPPPIGAPEQGGPDQNLAMELIRRGAAGDLAGALALATGVSEEMIRSQVTAISPSPLRAAPLPAPRGGPDRSMVWTQYRREGMLVRGAYVVESWKGKVTGIRGPLAPEGGYRPLPFQPYDESARPVRMALHSGRGLVLIAPRVPEPGLLETLTDLQRKFASYGVDFVLVLDIRAPDWASVARQSGFTGSIWRVKGKLEDVPVVTPGTVAGATGVLIDRNGLVVASLTALDPSRYGLPEQSIESVAPAVFKAYGLIP